MDPRRHPVPADGGDRLHGLRAAVGPDELLGRDRHHQPVLGAARRRRAVVTWLWGGFAVGNPTLNRFYSLHYLLPFVIAGVVVLHIWALHMVGQNNPTGVEPKTEKDTVAFTPYATVKDAFFIGVFCILFAWFIFYIPNYLGHSDNYIPANPGQTPTHIVPEWYYLPFYAILRAIPSKLLGVTALAGSIIILAFLPWLDTSRVRSANYRPLYRQFLFIFFAAVIGLGYLGSQEPSGGYVIAARILTVYYFAFFFIILPLLGLFETTKPLPNSISESVLSAPPGAKASGAGLAEAGHDFPSHHHRLRARGVACGDGHAGLGQERRAAAATLVVLRPVRHLRPGAAAARLQDLRGSLLDLPQPQAVGVPQSRRSGRSRLHRGAGDGDRGELPGHRRPERPGPDVPAARQARRSFPAAVPERPGRARRAWRQAAAGHVGARQGAQLRVGFPPIRLRRLHRLSGGRPRLHPCHPQRLYRSAGRLRAAAGQRSTTNISPAAPSACRSR